ncbi:MAG: radical protein, partial [Actinotalea sp.]|nr:radical protein [Actinotalea sp.]
WFMRWLAAEHPGLVAGYERLYGRSAYTSPEYKEWLHVRARPLLRRHGFSVGGRTSDGAVRAEEGAYPRGSMAGWDAEGSRAGDLDLPAVGVVGAQGALF